MDLVVAVAVLGFSSSFGCEDKVVKGPLGSDLVHAVSHAGSA